MYNYRMYCIAPLSHQSVYIEYKSLEVQDTSDTYGSI
jgi:hypothetical protein